MISKLLLTIEDKDTNLKYQESIKAHFSMITPIAAAAVLSLTIAVTVLQCLNLVKSPLFQDNFAVTLVVNWISVVIMIAMSILVRHFYHAAKFVGPLLTIYCFYYFCVVDFAGQIEQVYNVIVIGITITFLLLAFYLECWIVNSAISIPVFGLLMWWQSKIMLDSKETTVELVFRGLFLVFSYTVVAYKIDSSNKMAFLSKQSNEVSLNRWLKIFESFPEGISLVRNEEVVYSNGALGKILNLDLLTFKSIGSQEKTETSSVNIQKYFQGCKIKKYIRTDQSGMKRQALADSREITVWEFLQSTEQGGIYEILPLSKLIGETLQQNQTQSDFRTYQQTGIQRRYIQLRQISVRVGGRNEKLLIVRDDSYKVYLEQLKETKEQMQDFTDQMVQQFDDYALVTSDTLKLIDAQITSEGKPMVDDCSFEMKKMRYRIRDYRDVYDIADNEFSEPQKKLISLEACLKEVQNAVQNDLIRQGVEVSIAIHETCPQQIPVNNDLFIQVLINLLQQTVSAIGGRGFIKINTYKKQINLAQYLVIDFDASKFIPDKQMAINIINLAMERDLRKILSANVDLNFKIAKILSNQLGWRVEFNSFTASRYSLFIPLVNQRQAEETTPNKKEDDANLNPDEETKDETHATRPTTSLPHRIFGKTNVKGDKYKDNYEQLDQIDEHARPYSAQVPHLSSNHILKQAIKPVKEDPQMENGLDSPTLQNSTRTLGMDSMARAKLRGYRLPVDIEFCLLMNFTDLQLFDQASFKWLETFTEADALKKIQKSLDDSVQFKYFLIELEGLTRINLKWLVQSIRESYATHDKRHLLTKLKIIVIMTDSAEDVIEECRSLEVQFSLKPATLLELKAILNDTQNRNTVATTVVQNTTEV